MATQRKFPSAEVLASIKAAAPSVYAEFIDRYDRSLPQRTLLIIDSNDVAGGADAYPGVVRGAMNDCGEHCAVAEVDYDTLSRSRLLYPSNEDELAEAFGIDRSEVAVAAMRADSGETNPRAAEEDPSAPSHRLFRIMRFLGILGCDLAELCGTPACNTQRNTGQCPPAPTRLSDLPDTLPCGGRERLARELYGAITEREREALSPRRGQDETAQDGTGPDVLHLIEAPDTIEGVNALLKFFPEAAALPRPPHGISAADAVRMLAGATGAAFAAVVFDGGREVGNAVVTHPACHLDFPAAGLGSAHDAEAMLKRAAADCGTHYSAFGTGYPKAAADGLQDAVFFKAAAGLGFRRVRILDPNAAACGVCDNPAQRPSLDERHAPMRVVAISDAVRTFGELDSVARTLPGSRPVAPNPPSCGDGEPASRASLAAAFRAATGRPCAFVGRYGTVSWPRCAEDAAEAYGVTVAEASRLLGGFTGAYASGRAAAALIDALGIEMGEGILGGFPQVSNVYLADTLDSFGSPTRWAADSLASVKTAILDTAPFCDLDAAVPGAGWKDSLSPADAARTYRMCTGRALALVKGGAALYPKDAAGLAELVGRDPWEVEAALTGEGIADLSDRRSLEGALRALGCRIVLPDGSADGGRVLYFTTPDHLKADNLAALAFENFHASREEVFAAVGIAPGAGTDVELEPAAASEAFLKATGRPLGFADLSPLFRGETADIADCKALYPASADEITRFTGHPCKDGADPWAELKAAGFRPDVVTAGYGWAVSVPARRDHSWFGGHPKPRIRATDPSKRVLVAPASCARISSVIRWAKRFFPDCDTRPGKGMRILDFHPTDDRETPWTHAELSQAFRECTGHALAFAEDDNCDVETSPAAYPNDAASLAAVMGVDAARAAGALSEAGGSVWGAMGKLGVVEFTAVGEPWGDPVLKRDGGIHYVVDSTVLSADGMQRTLDILGVKSCAADTAIEMERAGRMSNATAAAVAVLERHLLGREFTIMGANGLALHPRTLGEMAAWNGEEWGTFSKRSGLGDPSAPVTVEALAARARKRGMRLAEVLPNGKAGERTAVLPWGVTARRLACALAMGTAELVERHSLAGPDVPVDDAAVHAILENTGGVAAVVFTDGSRTVRIKRVEPSIADTESVRLRRDTVLLTAAGAPVYPATEDELNAFTGLGRLGLHAGRPLTGMAVLAELKRARIRVAGSQPAMSEDELADVTTPREVRLVSVPRSAGGDPAAAAIADDDASDGVALVYADEEPVCTSAPLEELVVTEGLEDESARREVEACLKRLFRPLSQIMREYNGILDKDVLTRIFSERLETEGTMSDETMKPLLSRVRGGTHEFARVAVANFISAEAFEWRNTVMTRRGFNRVVGIGLDVMARRTLGGAGRDGMTFPKGWFNGV